MRVFISLKTIRQDAEFETGACLAEQVVRQAGHEPFAATRVITEKGWSEGRVFMPFVRQELHKCDLLLLLYHPELRGGLIEAGLAYAWNIPIWLAHPAGQRVSSSALGCASRVIAYRDWADFGRQLAGLFDGQHDLQLLS